MRHKIPLQRIILTLVCFLCLLGCVTLMEPNGTKAYATPSPTIAETPMPTIPVIEITVETASPETIPTPKPTPGPKEIRYFELSWQPIEAALYNKHIRGVVTRFENYQLLVFIPDTFHEITVGENGYLENGARVIAAYATEDEDYQFTIQHIYNPYDIDDNNGIDDLDDIAYKFVNDADKTVCIATINNVKFVDLECYQDNELRLITQTTNICPQGEYNDYLIFTFSPITAYKYSDITISIIGSIRPMFPETLPDYVPHDA